MWVEINSLSHSRAASNCRQQTTWSELYVLTETSRTCLCIFHVSGYNQQYLEQRIEWQAICDTMKLMSHHYNEYVYISWIYWWSICWKIQFDSLNVEYLSLIRLNHIRCQNTRKTVPITTTGGKLLVFDYIFQTKILICLYLTVF